MRIFFAASFILLISFCFPCQGEEGSRARKNPPADTQEKLREGQEKMERLQQGMEDQKSWLKDSRIREKSLLKEMEDINRMLRKNREQLDQKKKTMTEKEHIVSEREKEIDAILLRKEAMRNHVEKRLAAYYRMGSVSLLNIAFASETLPDLLKLHDKFTFIFGHDKKIFGDYREQISILYKAQMDMHREMAMLANAIEEVNGQERALSDLRLQKAEFLDKVRTEEQLYQRALEEIKAAAGQLTQTMTALKKQMTEEEAPDLKHIEDSPRKRKPAVASGFKASKGKLPPPVPGQVVTFFGKNTGKFGVTTQANGIDIKINPGAEIRAIYDGKVVYSGLLRGYGNLIIINHGEQFYSLISRAERLLKKEGQQVSQGEVIGFAGEGEGIMGEGLHFEIRQGTEPVDPLAWLDKEELIIDSAPKRR